MKNKSVFKFILSFITILLVSPAFALDWGVFEDYDENASKYALYKVLNNIPIKYAIEINPYKDDNSGEAANVFRGALEEKRKLEEFQTLIEKAFNTWPTDTRNMIIEEGRQDEFTDILNILPAKILLKRVSRREDANIVFIFSAKKDMACPLGAEACIFLEKNPIEVNLEDIYAGNNKGSKNELLNDIIHELGHYFALADQYKDDSDTSAVHSTFNRLIRYDSIMASSHSIHLACDDVDGFINLLDLSVKEFSDRAKNGWASFCNGKKNGKGELFKDEFYKKAKLVNKPSHTNGLYTQTFDKDGNLAEDFALDPFDLYEKEVLPSVVGYGMPGKMSDKKYNRKYSYTYNDIAKGEIKIWDESEEQNLSTYKYIREDRDGAVWSLDWVSDIGVHFDLRYTYNEECRIHNYIWGIRNRNKYLSMTLYYTKDNNFSSIAYDMKDVSQMDKNIKAKYPAYIYLSPEDKEYTCSIHEDIVEAPFIKLKLRGSNKTKLLEKDEEKLNNFARKYNVSEDEIIKNAYKLCNDMQAEGNKEKYKYKCDYFRKVEEFYHSRTNARG